MCTCVHVLATKFNTYLTNLPQLQTGGNKDEDRLGGWPMICTVILHTSAASCFATKLCCMHTVLRLGQSTPSLCCSHVEEDILSVKSQSLGYHLIEVVCYI